MPLYVWGCFHFGSFMLENFLFSHVLLFSKWSFLSIFVSDVAVKCLNSSWFMYKWDTHMLDVAMSLKLAVYCFLFLPPVIILLCTPTLCLLIKFEALFSIRGLDEIWWTIYKHEKEQWLEAQSRGLIRWPESSLAYLD